MMSRRRKVGNAESEVQIEAGSRGSRTSRGADCRPRKKRDREHILHDDGIQVLLDAEVTGVEVLSGDAIRLHMRNPHGPQTLEGSDILVAAARVPNTQGIGLEKTHVELDARGYVVVNDRLETTAPDIWAMEECAGSPHFTQVAFDDYRIVREQPAGRLPDYPRTARPILPVYGPGTGARRTERVGGGENLVRASRLAKIPMAAVPASPES
jgi:pyruvate/2-oxoglutarate dehydrogenase complex dihydrolipoamide dehydrogenase (E3) component